MLQGAQSTGTSGRRLLTSSAVRGYFNIYASTSSIAKPPPPVPFPSPPPVSVASPIVIGSIIWNDEFPVSTTLNSSYWTYQVNLNWQWCVWLKGAAPYSTLSTPPSTCLTGPSLTDKSCRKENSKPFVQVRDFPGSRLKQCLCAVGAIAIRGSEHGGYS